MQHFIIKKPIIITPSVLYSNISLLNKYRRAVPEAWDDFYDTLHLILNKERKLNNDISGYTGLFGSNK